MHFLVSLESLHQQECSDDILVSMTTEMCHFILEAETFNKDIYRLD